MVVTVRNVLAPAQGRTLRLERRRRRIRALAPRGAPVVCLCNGQPLLRAGWGRRVRAGDHLVFIVMPAGGGGRKNPLGMLLQVALMVAAPQIGASAAWWAAENFAISTSTFGLIQAGVTGLVNMAGGALINAALPGPTEPTPMRMQRAAAGSPTYSLAAQGNTARVGSPIPEWFGRNRIFMDWAAEPYAEYAGRDQYVYQLFMVGQGWYDIEETYIEDTPIDRFSDISTEVVEPGGTVTLFPTNVSSAAEVSGQELAYNVTVGPYVVVAAGQRANALAVDVVAPKGFYYVNDDGSYSSRSATVSIEARIIDDTGAPVGGWTELGSETLSGASPTPIRRSFRYNVGQERYEVRVTRTTTQDGSNRAGHDLVWGGLRAYLPGTQEYGDVTVIAMRMRASNSLSNLAARKINVVATRKLRPWSAATGWGAEAATRSIAWAAAHLLTSANGARLAESRVALDHLEALDAVWSARGDTFDGGFDTALPLWEALTTVLRAGRARPYQQGGVVHVARDAAASLPVGLFTMRNIARGSLRVEYLLPTDETADVVVVEYLDQTTWGWREVECRLPGSTSANPARVRLFGVGGRAQAWREGITMAAANRYRRRLYSWATEMEGFIPSPLDPVALAFDRPNLAQSGELVGWNVGTLTVTTSEPLTWTAGAAHYMVLRQRDGRPSGPWAVTAGATDYEAVLEGDPGFTPDVSGQGRERTHYSFGPGAAYWQMVRVVNLRPRGTDRVEILAVNESDAVHGADSGTPPADIPDWGLPGGVTRPEVTDLRLALGGTAGLPLAIASWSPAPGADRYYVERSDDGGETWVRIGDPAEATFSFPARRGTLRLRVAGVGLAVGDYATFTGDLFAVPPPDVDTFTFTEQSDGTRQFAFAVASPPPDLLGFWLRYKSGTGHAWGDLSPLHDGVLTNSPLETNQLAAGTYTVGCKAVDDSGNESENASLIEITVGDPRSAAILLHELPAVQGWPGTKTDCYVGSSGWLWADGTTTWASLTTWTAWTRWNVTPASPIEYVHEIDLGATVTFEPLVSSFADGTVTITEQHSDDDITYSSYAAVGGTITARYLRIKASVAGTLPVLKTLDIKISVAPVEEAVLDVDSSTLTGSYDLGVGNVRIPITAAFNVIETVMVALQNTGGAWTWELIDKDTSVGPQIKIRDATGALADATFDAIVKGL